MKLNMRNHIVLSVILLCLASQGIANAAVQPVVLFINNIVTNYTVPTGKVLLIEHLSASAANNAPTVSRMIVQTKIINVSNGGLSTMNWGFPVADKFQEVTLLRPLRVPAGGTVGINSTSNIGFNEVHMMGLLIDANDLYAANVGGSVGETKVADNTLSTTVEFASPRPVRLSSATSSDLTAPWSPNASEQKQRTSGAAWTVQTDIGGDQKFLKVAARAPETVTPVSP